MPCMSWNVMKRYEMLCKATKSQERFQRAKKGYEMPWKAKEKLCKAILCYESYDTYVMYVMKGLWKAMICYVTKWYDTISKDMQCGPMYDMISFAWKKRYLQYDDIFSCDF